MNDEKVALHDLMDDENEEQNEQDLAEHFEKAEKIKAKNKFRVAGNKIRAVQGLKLKKRETVSATCNFWERSGMKARWNADLGEDWFDLPMKPVGGTRIGEKFGLPRKPVGGSGRSSVCR